MKNTLKRVALARALAALITLFYAPVTHAAAQADRTAPSQADRAAPPGPRSGGGSGCRRARPRRSGCEDAVDQRRPQR